MLRSFRSPLRGLPQILITALVAVSIALAVPAALAAQQKVQPPTRIQRDTLSDSAKAEIRRVNRESRELQRLRQKNDTARIRAQANAAIPTAFADPFAQELLQRARIAREQQDSALKSYSAIATQRMSVGLGVRHVGLEKLLFRGDNVARVAWKRGVGVWVSPIGSRITLPMADRVSGDFSGAVSIPYFPGKETLWLPDGGMAKTDINERDIVHPIARGAEAYYRYATGDSLTIKLADGKVIRIRELRVTARKPDWRLFVGSFWFDIDGGQLVRAAYRLAVDIDIWSVASEEIDLERADSKTVAFLRDSIARATLSRELYKADSTRRAALSNSRNNNDDEPPAWVKASFRPAKAKLDAITIEYGLYQGRFWLPKANSASASAQVGFVRVPFNIDEKFTYESVDGDLSLPALPRNLAVVVRADSLRRAGIPDTTRPVARSDTTKTVAVTSDNNSGGDVEISVGACIGCPDKPNKEKRDSLAKATVARLQKQRDSNLAKAKTSTDSLRITERFNARREVQCQKDTVWVRTETRYDGALRVAYRSPCDQEKLANAKELPAAYTSDEELFDIKSRDELLSALDLSLQPAWSPQWPKLRSGLDLYRYNRIEGLSLGVEATQVLGAGYSARALVRIGHADLHANGELTVERSNGRRTAFTSVYHRLAAVNPEWGGALTLGPSLPAFLYARDEGFYYRTFGAEVGERYEQRRGLLEWRLFVEREYTAGDSDVVNTWSLGRVFGDRHYRRNILSEQSSFTGLAAHWQQAYGSNPTGFRLITEVRAEAATGTREYARGALDATLSRPLGRLAAAVSASSGYSGGTVPAQRLWYMGGLKSVRGQIAGTQEGDAFWLLRTEVGRRGGFLRPVGFFDIGWAGPRDQFGKSDTQRGAGVGLSLLDGLFRVDFSRGLFPNKKWRTDLYLEAPL